MKKLISLFVFLFMSSVFSQVDVTCWDGNCLKNGWTWANYSSGTYNQIACYRSGCEKSGWIAGSANQKYYTQCKSKGCFVEGWYDIDQATQNLRKQIVCRSADDVSTQTDCLKFGWVIYGTNGQEAVISCFEKDCKTKGWLVMLSYGQLIRANCKEGGCWQTGWQEIW